MTVARDSCLVSQCSVRNMPTAFFIYIKAGRVIISLNLILRHKRLQNVTGRKWLQEM
jgi:hypothetical protein